MGRPIGDGNGYVKLWRSIREHPDWFENTGEPATRMEALIYLMACVNWKQTQAQDGTVVDRGQMLTSHRALAIKFNWRTGRRRVPDSKRVTRWLRTCIKRDEVVSKSAAGFTVITLTNFSKWQDTQAKYAAEMPQECRTSAAEMPLSKEYKKGRIEEQTYKPTLEEVRPLANGKPIRTPESILSEARIMIGKCRAIGEKHLGHFMTEPPNTERLMKDLLRSRPNTGDTEGTILEVFEFYCRTTLKKASISFRWFFDHYETLEWKLRQERQKAKKA